MDKQEVLRELRQIWRDMIDPERELSRGKIANVKGIIRTDDGISCLFTLADFVEKPETVTKDMKVLLKKEKVSDPLKTRGIPYYARQIIIVE